MSSGRGLLMVQVKLDLLAIQAGATYTNTIRAVTRDIKKNDIFPQVVNLVL